MLVKKPKPDSIIYVKIQEFRQNKYATSKAITVYDTTAAKVARLIERALRAAAEDVS